MGMALQLSARAPCHGSKTRPSSVSSTRSVGSCGSGGGLAAAAAAHCGQVCPGVRPRSSSTCSTASGGSGRGFALAASSGLRRISEARLTLPPGRRASWDLVPRPPASEGELLADLEGRNGRWKQQRAQQGLDKLAQLRAEENEQQQAKEKLRQEKRDERAEWVRMQQEIDQEWMDARMKEHRLESERARRQAAVEEQARLEREALEAKRQSLRRPRPCTSCGGTGKCEGCAGTGSVSAVYLSSKVSNPNAERFYGRAVHGCECCGGRRGRDEAIPESASTHHSGSGKCATCAGTGATRPTEAEVEAALARRDAAGAGGLSLSARG